MTVKELATAIKKQIKMSLPRIRQIELTYAQGGFNSGGRLGDRFNLYL